MISGLLCPALAARAVVKLNSHFPLSKPRSKLVVRITCLNYLYLIVILATMETGWMSWGSTN